MDDETLDFCSVLVRSNRNDC